MIVVVALAACAPAPRVPAIDPATCAATLRARYAIDTAPAPAICAPLALALAPLGPVAIERIRGLAIVRGGRGRCGDACPDLAAALMSDATLAYYRTSAHALVVTDATFAGPRWRGGAPAPAALRAYLDGLGIDGPALVARLGLGALAPGDPRVFDAIVTRGPHALLGDASLVDLLRHELGHAVELHQADLTDAATAIHGWSSATGWRDTDGPGPTDGNVGGVYANEQPIVASRLVLGLPRGAGSYLQRGPTPTGYARFDPIEDFAEAFRLVHQDPVALGERSPVRLVIAAAGEVSLRAPALRRFVLPGVTALLADGVDPLYAMAILRAHGDALLPAIAPLADPRPLVIPADLDPEVRGLLHEADLVAVIGGLQFRPSDAAIAAYVARVNDEVMELREFNR
ncbi:MAG: hypothetical protein K8W52_19145 [Deltaproteobacteria bacterium]|nr:hypothetical protein [Deltaproteobacteria bacterium]